MWKVKDDWNIYDIIIDGDNKTGLLPGKETSITIFRSDKVESHCMDIVKITENHYGPFGSHKDSVFMGI